jgi:type IV pilus assembly protein PilB
MSDSSAPDRPDFPLADTDPVVPDGLDQIVLNQLNTPLESVDNHDLQSQNIPPSILNQITDSASVGQSAADPSQDDLLSLLQKNGHLNQDQVDELRLKNLQTGKDIETLIIEQKIVRPEDLSRAKAKMFDVPFISPNELTVSPEAIALVPKSVAQKFTILPFNLNQQTNELSVAMADPTDLQVIGFLEQKTNATIKPFAASREELAAMIEDRYGITLTSEVKQVIKETELGKFTSGAAPEIGVIHQAPIAKIISYIMEYAVNTRASDIHLEPEEDRTRIRYRIDGILYEKLVLPRQIHDALISKLKIMGKMKIDERRVPQDGRFNYQAAKEEVDLRVSSLPTVHGEKIVLRLLKKTGGAKTLPELGLRGRALKNLEEAILKPHGIIIVCGPTGSGKTTTLYSIITKINSIKVNILTLEDPVEYQMTGVNQVQINPQAGLSFASGLRSFLRQDPNVIMVGEVRDSETANLAIQAALTGHLVFSTLHTNNSAGSLPRLLDMGAEPFLLSSTINAVVAQRVVRVICDNCKVAYPATDEVVEDIKQVLGSLFPQNQPVSLNKGKGCQECNTTGYQGRVGIFEVLPMNEKISKLIMERAPASQIEDQSIKEGMISMKQDGYLKVLEGTTTMEEVLRVAQD